MMNSSIFKIVFLVCLLISTSCAGSMSNRTSKPTESTWTSLTNLYKSNEQIRVENAKEQLNSGKDNHKKLQEELTKISSTDFGAAEEATSPIVKYRRVLLDERKAYVQVLMDECELRRAILEKQSRDAGYFALSTKAVAIASGIASAILVVASSANAVYVAGLAAVSTGAAAFQTTAESVGYSIMVGQGETQALTQAVNDASIGFKDVSWSYLYDYAGHAKQTEWDSCMQKLGSAIVQLEAVIRFTKYEIKLTTSAQPTKPGAPTGVSAVPGSGQATVSFTAPASNGGSAIISYTVTSNPGDITAPGLSSPIMVPGLTAGQDYTFTVTATNGVGTGPASTRSEPVTVR